MIPGIVGGHISRANRNLFLFNAVMLLVLLGALVVASGFLYNFFMGPREIKLEEIPKMGDPGSMSRWWVKGPLDRHNVERGYVQISGSKRGTSYFYVMDLPEGGLIVESNVNPPPAVVEGTLGALTTEVDEKVLPRLVRPLGKPILQVMVRDSGVRVGGWIFCLIWLPLFALGIWNIVKAVRRMGNPQLHPVCGVLKRFGEPAEIAVAIDAEYRAGTEATGNVQLTHSWLMRKKSFGLDLVYLGDVVWAYKKEVKHRTNGVPTGTTYSSVVYDKYGKMLDMGLKKAQVEQLLANIHRAVPWVLVGYDKQLQTMWQKQRAKILGIVEERKAAYMKAGEAAANAPPVQANN